MIDQEINLTQRAEAICDIEHHKEYFERCRTRLREAQRDLSLAQSNLDMAKKLYYKAREELVSNWELATGTYHTYTD